MALLKHLRYFWLDDRLRLALIKENAAYRAFWERVGGDDAVAAYRTVFNEDPDDDGQQVPPSIRDLAYAFDDGLEGFGISVNPEPTAAELAFALSPFNQELPAPLPITFEKEVPVMQIVDPESSIPIEFENVEPGDYLGRLRPSERVLVIDLACRPDDILREMKRFLECVSGTREWIDRFPEDDYAANYEQWEPDVSRRREEAWDHLTVWRLRRQRKPYCQISRETGKKINALKKSFARAYELIEGRRYDPARYQQQYREIQTPELKRTCSTCPERGTCTDPCPDVLAYIDQDQVGLSERLDSHGK